MERHPRRRSGQFSSSRRGNGRTRFPRRGKIASTTTTTITTTSSSQPKYASKMKGTFVFTVVSIKNLVNSANTQGNHLRLLEIIMRMTEDNKIVKAIEYKPLPLISEDLPKGSTITLTDPQVRGDTWLLEPSVITEVRPAVGNPAQPTSEATLAEDENQPKRPHDDEQQPPPAEVDINDANTCETPTKKLKIENTLGAVSVEAVANQAPETNPTTTTHSCEAADSRNQEQTAAMPSIATPPEHREHPFSALSTPETCFSETAFLKADRNYSSTIVYSTTDSVLEGLDLPFTFNHAEWRGKTPKSYLMEWLQHNHPCHPQWERFLVLEPNAAAGTKVKGRHASKISFPASLGIPPLVTKLCFGSTKEADHNTAILALIKLGAIPQHVLDAHSNWNPPPSTSKVSQFTFPDDARKFGGMHGYYDKEKTRNLRNKQPDRRGPSKRGVSNMHKQDSHHQADPGHFQGYISSQLPQGNHFEMPPLLSSSTPMSIPPHTGSMAMPLTNSTAMPQSPKSMTTPMSMFMANYGYNPGTPLQHSGNYFNGPAEHRDSGRRNRSRPDRSDRGNRNDTLASEAARRSTNFVPLGINANLNTLQQQALLRPPPQVSLPGTHAFNQSHTDTRSQNPTNKASAFHMPLQRELPLPISSSILPSGSSSHSASSLGSRQTTSILYSIPHQSYQQESQQISTSAPLHSSSFTSAASVQRLGGQFMASAFAMINNPPNAHQPGLSLLSQPLLNPGNFFPQPHTSNPGFYGLPGQLAPPYPNPDRFSS